VLRWLALLPLVAFALSCLAPVHVDPSAATRRRTVVAARTTNSSAHAASASGAEPRVRFNAPTPLQLGHLHATPGLSLETGLFGIALSERDPRSLLVDHRALIRRLCRTQHRPPAAKDA
jgi:hypothetical protein